MITVHHLNDSRSQRIVWLLEELGVPYVIKRYQRIMPGRLAPPELRQVHALGKSPVITWEEENGDQRTLAESGAIIQYLIQTYGAKRLKTKSGVDDLYFIHYAEGTLMPLLARKTKFAFYAEHLGPWYLRPFVRMFFTRYITQSIDPELEQHRNLVESHLSKTEGWFTGGDQPSAADFAMHRALQRMIYYDVAGPRTVAYMERARTSPAYERAIERVGPEQA